ncbi:MAG: ACT domain-containing protein, partial [Gaiellales bacterium]
AALADDAVSNAVNIPGIAPEDIALLGPYISLAEKLGALAFALAAPHVNRLECTYRGRLAERDTRLLTLAALSGAFTGRVGQRVNLVSASVMARDRGVEVREESTSVSPDFTSLIEVQAVGDDRDALVAATITGERNRSRLVHALGYEIELELDPYMVFIINEDYPGVIGSVATTIGDAAINIATMAVSRNRRGGRALMAISTDTGPAPDVLDALRDLPGIADVRLISLEQ